MAELAKSQHTSQHDHAPDQSMHHLVLLHRVGQPGTPAEPFALALFWDLARPDSALLQTGCC